MGLDIALFLERQRNGRWTNPSDLADHFPKAVPTADRNVEVCWWPVKWPQTGLFFGPNAVVPMQLGPPPDMCSELSVRVLSNREEAPHLVGWSLVQDLCLDLWDSESVILTKDIPARFALAFGHGERMRHEVSDAIGKTSADAEQLKRLFWGAKLAGGPQDWATLRRHELYRIAPEQPIPMTWRTTIAEFAGPVIWENGLRRLRSLPEPGAYRIVTGLG